MELKEILQKLRKYEVRIRKDVNSQLQGNFSSIFKGTGLEFDDIRPYQYGDDVRAINWNVTAKGHGAYIKTFREEKDQTVFFYVDVSASQEIGAKNSKKIDIANEITGVLTLSAMKETSQVGLIAFSDQNELYYKAKKGKNHGYDMIFKLFKLTPKRLKTDLNKGFLMLLQLLKRKSMIVIISDFIDEAFDKNLKSLARKHDVVAIHINDVRESNFPKVGIVPMRDKETQKTVWINSSSSKYGNIIGTQIHQKREELMTLCKKNNINYLHLDTNEDFVPQLVNLFKIRNKIKKRA